MSKKLYNAVELQSMVENHNKAVGNGLYFVERNHEKDIMAYVAKFNRQNMSETIDRNKNLSVSDLFGMKLPVFEKYAVKMDNALIMSIEKGFVPVDFERMYNVVKSVQKLNISWENIGFSLLVLTGNAILEDKETPLPIDHIMSIGEMKKSIAFVGNISSQTIRDMAHLMSVALKETDVKVNLWVTGKEVRNALVNALRIKDKIHEYGKPAKEEEKKG